MLQGVDFASLTTLRVGGAAERLVEASTRDELVEALTGNETAMVIGGGSNLVVSDAGVRGLVVAVRTTGVSVQRDGDAVIVRAAAGESWDSLVERCVLEGWAGVEAMSGIPGSVGATPVQNVGAYGQEVSDSITRLFVLDRATSREREMSPSECLFQYRSSTFKADPDRYVVLEVEFRLPISSRSAPIGYSELAARLDIGVGELAPLSRVRDAVMDLRRSKGMVLDASDRDTWSTGSFFTNPILDSADVPADAPSWPQPDGRVKTSAAWLIQRAGFERGFGADVGTGRVTLSTKHTLAITNRGEATAEDVLAVARVIRQGVFDRFSVTLEPEPTLVGVDL